MYLILALLVAASTAGAEADFNEAYLACDEAATDQGFADAALPEWDKARLGTANQIAGRWQGTELLSLAVPTDTGTVFCMTTTDYRVVQYKFDGRTIIERD